MTCSRSVMSVSKRNETALLLDNATEQPPKMNHVASLSETAALCGAELDPFEPAFFGNEDDVCCVVCAEIWDSLAYSEKVALNRYWGA